MRILRGRNVCELLPLGADLLAHEGARSGSRAGAVLVAPWPVISVYERPTERVLVSARRDANPFFHLYESLWMLSGRNDTASLDHFVHDFGARFGEADGTMHGAYGHRWRKALGRDQFDEIVRRLRENVDDRQCVLQMWDATPHHEVIQGGTDNVGDTADGSGIYAGCDDLFGSWKDRPCNTHVYFRARRRDPRELGIDVNCMNPDGSDYRLMDIIETEPATLNMTVCCRSNDIVFGAYGANAVHFSVLMEYVAGRAGLKIGVMYQFSNNYHGYVDTLDRLGDPRLLLEEQEPYSTTMRGHEAASMGENWDKWDTDLELFMESHDELWLLPDDSMELDLPDGLSNLWFYTVAWNVVLVNWLHRKGRRDEALAVADRIEAGDWRVACLEWLERRYAR